MPGPLNRPALRRFRRIHEALVAGGFPNASVLAEDLEVTRRTVMRDIAFMRDQLGAPIEFVRAENGYRLSRGDWPFKLEAVLTEGEMVALYVAERCLAAEPGAPFAAELRRAIEKLAERLPDRVTVDASAVGAVPRGVRPADAAIFARLLAAVRERRRLRLVYRAAYNGRRSERTVDPLQVARVGGDWYCLCYDHARRKMIPFVPARVASVQETMERFEPPRGFDPAAHLASSLGAWTSGGHPVRVRVRFRPPASRYVAERRHHPSQRWIPGRDGSGVCELRVGVTPDLVSWILSWLPAAEVLAPSALRRAVAEAAAAGARRNGAGAVAADTAGASRRKRAAEVGA